MSKLLKQLVNVLDLGARACSNALFTGTLDYRGKLALVRRHGIDDRGKPAKLFIIDALSCRLR